MEDNRTEELKKVRDGVVNLTESPLYATRVKPVVGEGNHYARIMFVGEAPGRNEAEQGRPFCGAAGKILDELLASVGIKREDVYITNLLKDRPPGNRDPLPEEIALYAPFLDRQIEIIKPKAIVFLGRFSMAYLMKKFGLEEYLAPIGRIHGRVFKAETPWGEVLLLPLYHPAAVIYNQSLKEVLKKDFKALEKLEKGEKETAPLAKEKSTKDEEKPAQQPLL